MKLSGINTSAKTLSDLSIKLNDKIRLINATSLGELREFSVVLSKDELRAITWAGLLVDDANYLYTIEQRSTQK
jgi:hypothetical protein